MTLADRIAALPVTLQRVLAMLLVIAAGALVWFGVANPIRYVGTSQDSWRAAVHRQLAHDRGIAALSPAVRTQLSELRSSPVWARFYTSGAESDVRQQVQRDVMDLGAAAGIAVHSSTPLPETNATHLRSHGVRLAASMSVDQLKNFLGRVHGHSRYLRIPRLNVLAPQDQSQDLNPTLTVTLDIFGYSADRAEATGHP